MSKDCFVQEAKVRVYEFHLSEDLIRVFSRQAFLDGVTLEEFLEDLIQRYGRFIAAKLISDIDIYTGEEEE